MTTNTPPKPRVIHPDTKLHVDNDGGILGVYREQHLTPEFYETNRLMRESQRTGEAQSVARIPTAVVDSWLARGIPFWQMEAHEIMRLLKEEHMDNFLTTSKKRV